MLSIFKSSGLWCCTVPDISKNHSVTLEKTWIFRNTDVRTSNLSLNCLFVSWHIKQSCLNYTGHKCPETGQLSKMELQRTYRDVIKANLNELTQHLSNKTLSICYPDQESNITLSE
jgi:hypothetical protein